MKTDSARRLFGISLAAGAVVLSGCAGMEGSSRKYDVERHSVQSFEIPSPKMRADAAFSAVTAMLVERGFDIKISNKDAGLITTEYKKFASAGSSPPFDYYLQLRATIISQAAGSTVIRLTPLVKEQNRSNAAAFTERELYYHTGEPEGIRAADRAGWVTTGHTTFLNVVTDVSGRAGVQMEQVKKNTTVVRFNALFGGAPRT